MGRLGKDNALNFILHRDIDMHGDISVWLSNYHIIIINRDKA